MVASPPTRSRLNRDVWPTASAPVRIVHLGLGAFHRAHQAAYTDDVDPEREWGIAAFTGRRPDIARTLTAQDGRYTLIERSDSGDSMRVISSIVEAVDGSDLARLADLVASPSTAIITLTVTEAAYRVRAGVLQLDADVASDMERLVESARSGSVPSTLTTIAARLVFAIDARRGAGGGPIAVVPCDNLTDNAGVIRAAVAGFADRIDPTLAAWIDERVSFVATCVDRITPATTAADIALVADECGYLDEAAVVAEPFRDWVLAGEFPAGRPAWERAGAQFVTDIGPYELRKLRFLNGAHSLLAYQGGLRGYQTIAAAIADADCRRAVEAFWDLVEAQFGAEALDRDGALDLPGYRRHLLARFANRRINHGVAQVAIDGSLKLRVRIVPVVVAARPADRAPALTILAAWMDYLAAQPEVTAQMDAAAPEIAAALTLDGVAQTGALLGLLEPPWIDDDGLRADVHALRRTSGSPGRPDPNPRRAS